MKNNNGYFLKVCFLTISILVLAGCGGGSSSVPAPDPDPEPTSSAEQAALASDAVAATVAGIYALSVEEGHAEGSVSVITPSVGLVKASGVTEASSCAEGDEISFQSESQSSGDIEGTSGGSCTLTGEFVEIDGEAALIAKTVCTGYDNGDGLVLDGTFWMRSDLYGNITVVSAGLTSTTGGNECPLIINMTVSGSGNTATAGGCISECGSAFTIANRTQEIAGYCAGSAVSGFENMFSGSCTYVDETEPDDDDTFSYEHLLNFMDEESADDQLCVFMMLCHVDGIGDCFTMAQVDTAADLCDLSGGSGGGGDTCNDELAPSESGDCFQYVDEAACTSHYEVTDYEGETGTRNCAWTEEEFCGSYMTLCEMAD
jgi:hypothetical protein